MKPFVIMLKYACGGIKASEVSSRASWWGRCRLRAAGGCTPGKTIPRGCSLGWLRAWLGLTDLSLPLHESQSVFIVFHFNVSRLRALLFWKSYVSGYLVSSSVPEPFIALHGIIKTLSHILSLSFPHIDFVSAFKLFMTWTLYTWLWKKKRKHKFQLVNTVRSGTVFQFCSEGERINHFHGESWKFTLLLNVNKTDLWPGSPYPLGFRETQAKLCS